MILYLFPVFFVLKGLGLISKTEERVSVNLEVPYNNLLEEVEEVEESSYLHMVEIGHRNQGKRGWCWFLERIKSIYSTAKLRNQNPFDLLQQLSLKPI